MPLTALTVPGQGAIGLGSHRVQHVQVQHGTPEVGRRRHEGRTQGHGVGGRHQPHVAGVRPEGVEGEGRTLAGHGGVLSGGLGRPGPGGGLGGQVPPAGPVVAVGQRRG